MDTLQLFAVTVPSMLTVIGGVWFLSARIAAIGAKADSTAMEQAACNARHNEALKCTNDNVDKLEYRVDKIGNRVTALEVKAEN